MQMHRKNVILVLERTMTQKEKNVCMCICIYSMAVAIALAHRYHLYRYAKLSAMAWPRCAILWWYFHYRYTLLNAAFEF